MKKSTKRLFAAVLAAASLLALTACGGKTEEPKTDDSAQTEQPAESSGSKELSVYTAFPESEVIYYFNKFEEETGIKVNYVRLSAGEMLTRVEAEKDNPQATLMFGGSTDNYIAAVDKGLLEAYQSPNLSKTPDTYLDPTGTWNPIYVGCIAFACNADWFAEKGLEYPTSWEDLLKPEFKGEIIMAHPATSGTAYTVLATLVQLKGDDQVWDYLEKLNTNMSQYTKSGSAAPNAVAIGEAAIALTFSHDALQLTPEGYHIELSFPTDGTGYEVGAMALIKGGKGPLLVVDADANSNLNEVLGVEAGVSLGQIREEIAQAELRGDTIPKSMTKADYAEYRFESALAEEDDFDMLVMGRTQGKGCYCYVNGVLKTLLDKYIGAYRYVVIDNEAGMEHIARGTLPHVDALLLVSDCSRRGVQAVARIAEMVRELDLKPGLMKLIINRAPGGVLSDGVREEIEAHHLELAGVLPQDDAVYEADCDGKPSSQVPDNTPVKQALHQIMRDLNL